MTSPASLCHQTPSVQVALTPKLRMQTLTEANMSITWFFPSLLRHGFGRRARRRKPEQLVGSLVVWQVRPFVSLRLSLLLKRRLLMRAGGCLVVDLLFPGLGGESPKTMQEKRPRSPKILKELNATEDGRVSHSTSQGQALGLSLGCPQSARQRHHGEHLDAKQASNRPVCWILLGGWRVRG